MPVRVRVDHADARIGHAVDGQVEVRRVDRDAAAEELVADPVVAPGVRDRRRRRLGVLRVRGEHGARVRRGAAQVFEVQAGAGAAEQREVLDVRVACRLGGGDRLVEACDRGLEHLLRRDLRAVLLDDRRAEALTHEDVAVTGVRRGLRDQIGAVLDLRIRPLLELLQRVVGRPDRGRERRVDARRVARAGVHAVGRCVVDRALIEREAGGRDRRIPQLVAEQAAVHNVGAERAFEVCDRAGHQEVRVLRVLHVARVDEVRRLHVERVVQQTAGAERGGQRERGEHARERCAHCREDPVAHPDALVLLSVIVRPSSEAEIRWS